MWTISKSFTFEAAHKLPSHDGHCARLHGHSFKGYVYVSGNALVKNGPKQGMVLDYADIKRHLKPLVDNFLDHYYLNDTTKLENPTSEELARWIYDKLKPELPELIAIRIDETCTSTCIYCPTGDGLSIAGNAIAVG